MTPEPMTNAELSKQLALLLGYEANAITPEELAPLESSIPPGKKSLWWIEIDGQTVSDYAENEDGAWATMQPNFAEDVGSLRNVAANHGLGVDVSVLQPDALVIVTLFRDAVPILKRTGEDAARVLCEALIEVLGREQMTTIEMPDLPDVPDFDGGKYVEFAKHVMNQTIQAWGGSKPEDRGVREHDILRMPEKGEQS